MVPYMLGSWKIGAEELNAANALMVMILIPILTPLCLWLGKLASPLRRMTVGMMLAGVSFLLIARIQARLDAGESLSILHQLAPYFVLTAAEVLVSTTGLEFAFTQAPASLKSVLSGLWQFNVAVGNTLVLLITTLGKTASGDSAATTDRFLFYALLTFGVSVCFAIVAKLYPEKSQQTPA
jgi:POT family proton-dependent oligopeptide transporter